MQTYRLRVNRRGMFWVRYEQGPANGSGVHIWTLWRWQRPQQASPAEQELLTRAAQSPTVRRQRTRITEQPLEALEALEPGEDHAF